MLDKSMHTCYNNKKKVPAVSGHLIRFSFFKSNRLIRSKAVYFLLQMRTTISIIVAISNSRVNTSSVLILHPPFFISEGKFDRLRYGADTRSYIIAQNFGFIKTEAVSSTCALPSLSSPLVSPHALRRRICCPCGWCRGCL